MNMLVTELLPTQEPSRNHWRLLMKHTLKAAIFEFSNSNNIVLGASAKTIWFWTTLNSILGMSRIGTHVIYG